MGFFDKILRSFESLLFGERGEVEIERKIDIGGGEPIDRSLFVFRHYTSTLHYCGGKKRSFYALTYATDDQTLEDELLGEIESQTINSCSPAREDYGYSVDFVDGGGNPEYPNIEFGEL